MAVDNDTKLNPDAVYRVKNAVFEYFADTVIVHPQTGEQVPIKAPRFAFRRDILEGLSEDDARRGLNRDEIVAVRKKDVDAGAAAETVTPGIVGANAEEIAEWIRAKRPTVTFLVEQVGDNSDLASQVLEAEEIATDDSPRATLVTALTNVIESGGPDEDEEEPDEEEEELDEEEEED